MSFSAPWSEVAADQGDRLKHEGRLMVPRVTTDLDFSLIIIVTSMLEVICWICVRSSFSFVLDSYIYSRLFSLIL